MARSATATSRSTPTARRVSRKAPASAAAGAAQKANGDNLKNMTKQTQQPAPSAGESLTQRANAIVQGNTTTAPAPQTNDANLVMPHIQHSVLVSSIKSATAGFKAAINLEIAVCCAVFIEAGDTSAKAKKELYSVYGDAGFDCKVGGEGKDYKTVNRRIGYAAQFYDSLEEDSLKDVMGEARDEAALQVLVAHIATKYNFRDMSDVLEAAGVQPVQRQRQTPPQGGNGGAPAPAPQPGEGQSVFPTSATATPTGTPQGPVQPDAGDQGVMAAIQQAGEQRAAAGAPAPGEFADKSKWVRYTYEGATLILPMDMAPVALAELGIKLMQAANHMRGASIDVATLNHEFKEAVAAH